MAKLHLWRHEYELAEKHLVGFGGQLRPLTRKQVRQLEEIADLDQGNKDPHPLATALRLKAFAQLLKNRADFRPEKPLGEGLLQKMLMEQYPRYLENLEYSGKMLLTPEEELLILRCPGHSQATVANRVRQLEAESYGMLSPFAPAEVMLPVNRLPEGLKAKAYWWVSDFGKFRDFPTAILHANLATDFIFYYRMARDLGSKSLDEVREFAHKLSGVDHSILSGLSKEALVDICTKVLNMKLHREDAYESASALMLKMTLSHPDKFPDAADVVPKLETAKRNWYRWAQEPAEEVVARMLDQAKKLYTIPESGEAKDIIAIDFINSYNSCKELKSKSVDAVREFVHKLTGLEDPSKGMSKEALIDHALKFLRCAAS